MEKVKIESLRFENEVLKRLTERALQFGFRVYVFQERVGQIFFEDEAQRVGSASAFYSSLSYSTVHKPCRQAGTGYQLERETFDTRRIWLERACQVYCPDWDAKNFHHIKKHKCFAEKAEKSILDYKEVIQ